MPTRKPISEKINIVSALGVDTGEFGGFRIAAHGEDIAAEFGAGGDEGHGTRQRQASSTGMAQPWEMFSPPSGMSMLLAAAYLLDDADRPVIEVLTTGCGYHDGCRDQPDRSTSAHIGRIGKAEACAVAAAVAIMKKMPMQAITATSS